jgi:Tannase and feruloyl esterase
VAAKKILMFTTFAMFCLAASPVLAASCESLASLKLPETTITSANTVAAGAFRLPTLGGSAVASQFSTLPTFCRVTATLTPSSDSDIKVEVWLPISGWNGKFQAVGNGGFAGVISYSALAAAVTAGYATASTDAGHQGNTAAFALGHPEKVIDFADRAVHYMTVQAKTIVNAYYGSAPSLSFWNGCSQGGRQGITEAAKYPSDFEGIVAGASGINNMRLMIARMVINVFAHRSADSYIPPEKYALVHEAVLKECDALDGVKDGVIENPAVCHFDPKILVCKDADGPNCLTAAQVETARALYSPIKNPKTGAQVMPALLQPGSELGWAILAGPEPIRYSTETFEYLVFKDPEWDWHRFNAATDIDAALKADNGLLEFTDPNLKPFFDRGGKLLMYHGWADPQVTPMNSVNYFKDVVKRLGAGVVGKSIELYMVPGMNHCAGGPGTDSFNKMEAIEQWLASGTAPKQILASHLTNRTVDRTRPLCPYPQVAAFKGSGSTDDATNFVCKAP